MANTYNIVGLGMDDSTLEEIRLTEILNQTINNWKAVLNGDIVLACSPATLTNSASDVNTAIGGDGFTREIALTLKDSAGNDLKYTGTLAVAVSKSSTSGTITIEDSATTVAVVNGAGSITVVYAGTWANTDTCTLTITGGTMAGATVTNKTSVDTLIA